MQAFSLKNKRHVNITVHQRKTVEARYVRSKRQTIDGHRAFRKDTMEKEQENNVILIWSAIFTLTFDNDWNNEKIMNVIFIQCMITSTLHNSLKNVNGTLNRHQNDKMCKGCRLQRTQQKEGQ